MNTIGERIKYLRDLKGLSMGKLEKALGVAGGSVDKWEKDKSVPGGKALINLSNYFSVSVDWILKGEEPGLEENEAKSGTPFEISPSDLELLAKFHQLTEKEQGRIEERIEIYLSERKTDSSSKQSYSTNGDGREEAATRSA
ncbi:helix-turn-helix domain-containing protein [Paenibacillus melissococcoides]|uniref:Helix-turn-helix domain-containing protein n=1 Tax=Paenibacillus melissococcoides TaxID=2912268 RepID=A0ABM9G3Q0_9BACL|nr:MULTISPECIES: helix-turn-helix domain-containing protein [Paenibacillus]MEB9897005.1 helix-turn-helix domain-containing protein [Bacillus cereus]CAH8246350.1 helix-turn-helix domain-containing protein [Paenibacillus melissococcoides]CAH8714481.1 helix-turn-helix domain-containing protein [Paenibacillus melissococcoides]CAH8715437.1 helix-turn-helix domain-containing protein [Paenibacillus melissococcoides]GIO82662.1 transcriptional regulator [Paenibacillus dendritiformis]